MSRALVAAVAVAAALSGVARAQDKPAPAAASVIDRDWHPYVFSVDGSTLAPRTAAIESGAGYNGVTGAGGGLSPDDARRVMWWLSGAVGLVDRVQLQGSLIAADDPTNGFGFNQAQLNLQVEVLRARPRFPVAISAGVGYQVDAVYDHAVTGLIAASAYLGRLNLVIDVRAAHYFAAGRDPVDLFVTTGALVRATRWLRVGAEYVGEELEGVTGEDGDNSPGGRHYVGPTAVVQLLSGKLRLNATGGAVISRGQAGPLVRGGLAYLF
jgi:hypothetical protein